MTKKTIEFMADTIKANGPLVGGNYRITIDTGEYEAKKVSQIFLIPVGSMIKVKLEYD